MAIQIALFELALVGNASGWMMADTVAEVVQATCALTMVLLVIKGPDDKLPKT